MFDRYARLRQIEALHPERDGAEIRRLSADDFYDEYEEGLQLALFRTFAVPTISALLESTGAFVDHGPKRYDDTTLILYEILKDGPDSERGRAAVRQLNRIHGGYAISNEDYVYTLATFVVVPARWIARYGWRPVSNHEVEASVAMYRRLGAMMGLKDVPETYAAFADLLDAYETQHVRHASSNARIAEATLAVFASRLPVPLRPLVRPVVSAILEPPLRAALGFAPPPPRLPMLVHRALRMRARARRHLPVTADGSGRRAPYTPTYPCGYAIEDLGPPTVRHCPRAP